MVAGVCLLGALWFGGSAVLAIVIMQAPEVQIVGGDGARQREYLVRVVLVDAGAIHAGIDVQKNSHAAAAPLVDLVFVFGKDGNGDLRELLGDFSHAERVCAHGRIGEEDVCRAALACYEQFQCGGALEISDAARDEHTQGVAEFGGFDVRAPAVRIAAEQFHGAIDVCGKDFRIKQQGGREDVRGAGYLVARVPGEFGEHGFLRGHLWR